MTNQDIHQNEWGAFLDDFSRRHLGEPVTVEVLSHTEGQQTVASGLPLIGVVDDPKNSEGLIVEIIAGASDGQNVVHTIPHPTHIRLAKADDGRDVAVEFESDNAPRTLLRFEPTKATQALPT